MERQGPDRTATIDGCEGSNMAVVHGVWSLRSAIVRKSHRVSRAHQHGKEIKKKQKQTFFCAVDMYKCGGWYLPMKSYGLEGKAWVRRVGVCP